MKEDTVWSMDRFNDHVNSLAKEKGLPRDWVHNQFTVSPGVFKPRPTETKPEPQPNLTLTTPCFTPTPDSNPIQHPQTQTLASTNTSIPTPQPPNSTKPKHKHIPQLNSHKLVCVCNHGPLLFILFFGNSSLWFCTRFPTVDLSRTVDPIVLFCYRSPV